MAEATITSKGQITIPAVVRAAMKLSSGDRLEFVALDNGRFEIVAVNKEVGRLKGL